MCSNRAPCVDNSRPPCTEQGGPPLEGRGCGDLLPAAQVVLPCVSIWYAEPIQPGPSRSIVGTALVPGPVRMHSSTLEAMATPAMTARAEFRAVMTDLNHGLRHAFNLSPGSDVPGHGSWTGDDGYRVIVVSGPDQTHGDGDRQSIHLEDRILVPTNGKFGRGPWWNAMPSASIWISVGGFPSITRC